MNITNTMHGYKV